MTEFDPVLSEPEQGNDNIDSHEYGERLKAAKALIEDAQASGDKYMLDLMAEFIAQLEDENPYAASKNAYKRTSTSELSAILDHAAYWGVDYGSLPNGTP